MNNSSAQIEPAESAEIPVPGDLRTAWIVSSGLALACFLLSLFVYFQSWSSMAWTWVNIDTYGYGLVVPALSALMIWSRRHEFNGVRPGASVYGLIAVAICVTGWLLGEIAGVQVLQHAAILALIPSIGLTFFGVAVMRRIALPAMYVMLAVPIGDELVPQLIQWTADFSVFALEAIGIPVYLDGPYIRIPAGNFEVVKACSGIRYLLTSVVLGVLFAFLSFSSWYRRALFVLVCIVVPIIANWLRATGIILLGHYSDMKIAAGVDHFIYGWIFFGLVMLVIFLIGNLFHDKHLSLAPEHTSGPDRNNGQAPGLAAALLSFVATAVLLLGSSGVGAKLTNTDDSNISQRVDSPLLPAANEPWSRSNQFGDDWNLQFVGASRTARGSYTGPDGAVNLAVVHYARQRQGAELISSQNQLFDADSWWPTADREEVYVAHDFDAFLKVRETIITDDSRSRMIWNWYFISGANTNSRVMAKMLTLESMLTGSDGEGFLIALATDFGENAGAARQRLGAFLDKQFQPLSACLDVQRTSAAGCEF